MENADVFVNHPGIDVDVTVSNMRERDTRFSLRTYIAQAFNYSQIRSYVSI